MTTMTIEAKRVKKGQSLTDFATQGQNAVNRLVMLKQNLLNLKTAVQEDEDFTVEDAAEVQAVINNLAAQIQGILS